MEGTNIHPSRISEFGALEQSLGFRVEDAMNLSRSMLLMFGSLAVLPLFLFFFFCFAVNFCYIDLICCPVFLVLILSHLHIVVY